jgi:sarcosine oxidase delta subunit
MQAMQAMEERRFRCPSCNETFVSAEEFRKHGEMHAQRAEAKRDRDGRREGDGKKPEPADR